LCAFPTGPYRDGYLVAEAIVGCAPGLGAEAIVGSHDQAAHRASGICAA